jgi:hypothetical protein
VILVALLDLTTLLHLAILVHWLILRWHEQQHTLQWRMRHPLVQEDDDESVMGVNSMMRSGGDEERRLIRVTATCTMGDSSTKEPRKTWELRHPLQAETPGPQLRDRLDISLQPTDAAVQSLSCEELGWVAHAGFVA